MRCATEAAQYHTLGQVLISDPALGWSWNKDSLNTVKRLSQGNSN
jgi:hypothetical protein